MLQPQETQKTQEPFSLRELVLPKWSQMCVWGVPVTVAQAKEIICRTDTFLTSLSAYAGGNNHDWNNWAHAQMGLTDVLNETGPYGSRERYQATQELAQNLGHIRPEYVSNSWASSSFIGGPHGWCHPDGTILFNDNVGKWPSAQELLDDWGVLARAFPFLSLTATFMSDEAGADAEAIQPVFSIVVKDGTAIAVKAIAPPPETEKTEAITDFFMRTFHDARREQGLPDAWIEELGARSRAALADILKGLAAQDSSCSV